MRENSEVFIIYPGHLPAAEHHRVFSLPGFSGPPQRVGPGSDRMTGLAYEEGTKCSNHGSKHASSNSTSNNGTMNYVINPIGDVCFFSRPFMVSPSG